MKTIVCICAVALLFEAVVGMPYADTADEFDTRDLLSKRVVDILSPASHYLDKRGPSACPMDCFSCFKLIRDMTPENCVMGCRTQGRKVVAGDASYTFNRQMWHRCANYLQRPLV